MSDYFDDYFFTSNVSDHTCPGFGSFVCKPPNACARDPNTGRRFCCDVKDVCWTITETCANDGSTLDCGTGTTTWCCVNGRERCTAAKNQINICWSTAHDILNNITNKDLNNTYSSLSSAHPSATTWAFSPDELIAKTAPPTSPASSSAADSSATSGASSPAGPTGSSGAGSSGIGGGAIAGIVVGSIAGVALIVAGLFFLWRLARNQKDGMAAAGYPDGTASGAAAATSANGLDDKPRYAGAPNFGAHGYTNTNSYYTGSPSPHPPPSSVPTSELHGDNLIPQELPANQAFGANPSELSATSPTVGTHYSTVNNSAGSPAIPPAAPAAGSVDVPPEQAYQWSHQASGTAPAVPSQQERH
ncbi:hypothetical protein HMPREF1624_06776 [Sporothrix schenckii ATCC 58251]|uniref:Mid2 domain-containing protein n=1 Tax=Sporothrix schenckii (strain ATCC 58251 / de Perez 2211183) TaxID=1391915 RepID=U7PPA4_SPOS1|nr:hypothetical protein HMPREF1624_06776 [Sporothrix schenckii ATCC 58251]